MNTLKQRTTFLLGCCLLASLALAAPRYLKAKQNTEQGAILGGTVGLFTNGLSGALKGAAIGGAVGAIGGSTRRR